MDQIINIQPITESIYPLMTGAERLAIWQEARGTLKNRTKEVLAELETVKNEIDGDLPDNS